jgi:hypothetical protein
MARGKGSGLSSPLPVVMPQVAFQVPLGARTKALGDFWFSQWRSPSRPQSFKNGTAYTSESFAKSSSKSTCGTSGEIFAAGAAETEAHFLAIAAWSN